MKNSGFLIITSFILATCNNPGVKRIERKDNPAIYSFESTDERMNVAIKKAKQTNEQFDKALLSKNPNFKYFCLKVHYDTPEGREHIWVANINIKNGGYSGVIADEPNHIIGLKMYDSVQIDRNNISDWMYLENGKLRGGYTIRAIRDQMSPQERKEYDSKSSFIIED